MEGKQTRSGKDPPPAPEKSKGTTICNGCKKGFKSLVQHLRRNKECQNDYGEAFEEILAESRSQSKRNFQDKNQTQLNQKECRCCKRKFVSLVQHIRQTKKCKENYGPELEKMTQESNKSSKKRHYQANASQIIEKQAKKMKEDVDYAMKRHLYFENYNNTHNIEKREKMRKLRQTRTEKRSMEDRVLHFKRQIATGILTIFLLK